MGQYQDSLESLRLHEYRQLRSFSISFTISLRVQEHNNHEAWSTVLGVIQRLPPSIRHLNIGFSSSGILDWVLATLDWEALGNVLQRFTSLEVLSFTNTRYHFLRKEKRAFRRSFDQLRLRPAVATKFYDGRKEGDDDDEV